MNPLDAGFWQLEDGQVALHIGAVAVFAGPIPDLEQARLRYANLVARTPRYRQRMRSVPFDLERPMWIDDSGLDLDYHVRRTALPAPGAEPDLLRLVGRIMSTRLDPGRPLWEAWLVEGLSDDRWAIIWKIHHSVVDGMGGMELISGLFDVPPGPARGRRRRSHPVRAPGTVELLASGVADAVGAGRRAMQAAVRVGTRPGHAIPGLVTGIRGGLNYVDAVAHPVSPTSLTGPLGSARRYRVVTVELAEVNAVRAVLGGSINDVALTMISRGFRDLLLSRHEAAIPRSVRALVPVSVRSDLDQSAVANKVSGLLLDLPVDFAEAAAAHGAVTARMRALKSSGEAAGGVLATALAGWIPAPAMSAAVRATRRLPQRVVTTVTTNVPGPRTQVRMLEREMVALYPYVPIGDRIRIAVALTSYNGRLYFGVTSDRDSVPDIEVLLAGLSTCLLDLAKNAAGTKSVRS